MAAGTTGLTCLRKHGINFHFFAIGYWERYSQLQDSSRSCQWHKRAAKRSSTRPFNASELRGGLWITEEVFRRTWWWCPIVPMISINHLTTNMTQQDDGKAQNGGSHMITNGKLTIHWPKAVTEMPTSILVSIESNSELLNTQTTTSKQPFPTSQASLQ